MKSFRRKIQILIVAACCGLGVAAAVGAAAVAELRGIDFQGGGQSRFGAAKCGRDGVNYVYARPTGAAATMTATFSLAQVAGGADVSVSGRVR